jgi:hypothetical protein
MSVVLGLCDNRRSFGCAGRQGATCSAQDGRLFGVMAALFEMKTDLFGMQDLFGARKHD